MKHQHRSAIVIVVASVVGGTGPAWPQLRPCPAPASSHNPTPATTGLSDGSTARATLAARLREVVTGTDQLNRRLVAARHDLAQQSLDVTRLRTQTAAGSSSGSVGAVSPVAPVAPARPARGCSERPDLRGTATITTPMTTTPPTMPTTTTGTMTMTTKGGSARRHAALGMLAPAAVGVFGVSTDWAVRHNPLATDEVAAPVAAPEASAGSGDRQTQALEDRLAAADTRRGDSPDTARRRTVAAAWRVGLYHPARRELRVAPGQDRSAGRPTGTTRTTTTRAHPAPPAPPAPPPVRHLDRGVLMGAATAFDASLTFRSMATDVTLRVVDPDDRAPQALDRAHAVFERVAAACTRFDPSSPLMRANDDPSCWHEVPVERARAVSEAARAHADTKACSTRGCTTTWWSLGYDRTLPFAEGAIHRARAARIVSDEPAASPAARRTRSRWQPQVEHVGDHHRVHLDGARIDLGGIGKGLAVRWAAQELHGVGTSTLVEAGGDCQLTGADRPATAGGSVWRIAGGPDPLAVFALSDLGCATSSVRVRRWVVDGHEVHHIIDPRTGLSGGAGLASVTVIHADAAGQRSGASRCSWPLRSGSTRSPKRTAWRLHGSRSTARCAFPLLRRTSWSGRRPMSDAVVRRRRAADVGLLIGFVASVVTTGWLLTGTVHTLHGNPSGAWMVARASGITSYLLMTALVVMGMHLSHPGATQVRRLSRLARVQIHSALAFFTLAFTTLHVVVLATDPFAHVGWAGALLPMASTYRPVPVTLGVVAMWSAVLTGVTASLAGRLPGRILVADPQGRGRDVRAGVGSTVCSRAATPPRSPGSTSAPVCWSSWSARAATPPAPRMTSWPTSPLRARHPSSTPGRTAMSRGDATLVTLPAEAPYAARTPSWPGLLLEPVQVSRTGAADRLDRRDGRVTEAWDEHVSTSRGASPGALWLLDAMEEAGLTGYGGGHFPVARKWRGVLGTSTDITVVANGSESESLSGKDATLLRQRPHLVLDGLHSAMETVRARHGVVWLHESDRYTRRVVEDAIHERAAHVPWEADVRVVAGPSTYLAGESSAIGVGWPADLCADVPRRPAPSRRPRRAVDLLLVHNVETLARVRPRWLASVPSPRAVNGWSVRRPGRTPPCSPCSHPTTVTSLEVPRQSRCGKQSIVRRGRTQAVLRRTRCSPASEESGPIGRCPRPRGERARAATAWSNSRRRDRSPAAGRRLRGERDGRHRPVPHGELCASVRSLHVRPASARRQPRAAALRLGGTQRAATAGGGPRRRGGAWGHVTTRTAPLAWWRAPSRPSATTSLATPRARPAPGEPPADPRAGGGLGGRETGESQHPTVVDPIACGGIGGVRSPRSRRGRARPLGATRSCRTPR